MPAASPHQGGNSPPTAAPQSAIAEHMGIPRARYEARLREIEEESGDWLGPR
jgi:hypothetical protein